MKTSMPSLKLGIGFGACHAVKQFVTSQNLTGAVIASDTRLAVSRVLGLCLWLARRIQRTGMFIEVYRGLYLAECHFLQPKALDQCPQVRRVLLLSLPCGFH